MNVMQLAMASLMAVWILPSKAGSQQAPPPSSTPATIAATELENMRITTVNRYQGLFRHARGEGPGRIEVHTSITLGPDGAIAWHSTRNVVAETPKGNKRASLQRSGKGKIGVPGKVSDGSGDLVWVMDGSALVRMRTMASGGHLQRVTLTKTQAGWSCKSDAPFAREVGGSGRLEDRAAMPGGGQVEILRIAQTGSNCSVTRSP
jgi:hypothetical protein